MLRTVLRVFTIVIAIVVLWAAWALWLRPGGEDEVQVRIPDGATFDQIVDSLDASGALANAAIFRLYAVVTGSDTRVLPGTYRFNSHTAAARLLSALVEGRSTVREKVTFPEGITLRRVASIVHSELGIDSTAFMRRAHDRAFLDSIGIDAPSAEGLLMPDTYFFFWGTTPEHVIGEMHALFTEFFTDSLKARAATHELTPYQAIVLASIVEGEARVDQERPVIAGLYLNRLERHMRLQADPTVQYIIPDGPRRLTYDDLRIDSPYNTYEHEGLPPTPINNPGRRSILAVLNADDNDFLYMVARADGTGRHAFSVTSRAHEAAREVFRRNRRQQLEQMRGEDPGQ